MLAPLLQRIGDVAHRYPEVGRNLYLVDEEFIGRGDGSEGRALGIAKAIHQAGFKWESSTRTDQVASADEDEEWHARRAAFWRELQRQGLRRMLFGVESGVDSVLQRFAKGVTREQNIRAIRTLSALGVPTRFTYITFDHLMTLQELRASYEFLGRTDLLLRASPQLEPSEISAHIQDTSFISANGSGTPFYSNVTYMLVTMECLTSSAYTRMVREQGLALWDDPGMGRTISRFADWRIEAISHFSQKWIDRNFVLDYTLKGFEKAGESVQTSALRGARALLKRGSYDLLGDLVRIAEETSQDDAKGLLEVDAEEALEHRYESLVQELLPAIEVAATTLHHRSASLLRSVLSDWVAKKDWQLINPPTRFQREAPASIESIR